MEEEIANLVDLLKRNSLASTGVISWGAPVPAFGDVSSSRLATLGINPSNREFVNSGGEELDGPDRRFHTLRSLGITGWDKATAAHYALIAYSCMEYFSRNPYHGWFNSLDSIISKTGYSYYNKQLPACHLDLSPFATTEKWTSLSSGQKKELLAITGNSLGVLLRDSPVQVLVLNGRTVVENFQGVASQRLATRVMRSWTLPRSDGFGVEGVSYKGWVTNVAGISLDREILVLGYNHNIQSSFGVTRKVKDSISEWVAKNAGGVLQ